MSKRYDWVRDMSHDTMTPDEVRKAREVLGLTQKKFGEAVCGIDQGNVSRAENELGFGACTAKIVRLLLDAHTNNTTPEGSK